VRVDHVKLKVNDRKYGDIIDISSANIEITYMNMSSRSYRQNEYRSMDFERSHRSPGNQQKPTTRSSVNYQGKR